MRNILIDELIYFFKSLNKIFKYKNQDKKYTTKKILVAGGYGYGNVGDEAQCNETLRILKERYPSYQIINLTPNIEYSKSQHPDFIHDYASRVLLFNQNRECNCFDFNNSLTKKIIFLAKAIIIYFNALLIRADLPVFLINSRIAKFLYELKECSLLYYCGGGYLTGGTLSRLWDGIIVCRLAHLFKTPVVMSGQTIGVWRNNFNKTLAKWGFKHVNIITVRDEEYSLNDLRAINLQGKNYFTTHDDALFCAKAKEKQINDNNYIALNFHHWGMNQEEKSACHQKINKIISYITEKTNYNIVFIPMHETDSNCFDEYITKYPNNKIKLFNYDYDFRKLRRAIADSKICITMKHHPIIFAMGENIPTISIDFSDYYMHKNKGALAQYGLSDYSINLADESYFEKFKEKYNNILEKREIIVNNIVKQKEILKVRKDRFLKMVDKILENSRQ